jgi:hypothetical protein
MKNIELQPRRGFWAQQIASPVLVAALSVSFWSATSHAQKPLPPSKMLYPLEWEFKTPPPRGTVTPGSACEVAEEYVRQINAKRPATGVAELFAEDGVVLQGGGKLLRGRKEIHAFYDVTDGGRGVIPLSFIDNGAECDMEIAIQRYGPDETWRLAGSRHFTMTPDRKIARLIYYSYGGAAPSQPQGRGQQPGANTSAAPMGLTALDYIEIQQLVARYSRALDTCANNGYDYADLYTADGWFAAGRDGQVGTKFQGRDRLAEAAGGGSQHCAKLNQPGGLWIHTSANHVITPSSEGATGVVDLVYPLEHGGGFDTEHMGHVGHYEDVYVKTAQGWRFKSRIHVLSVSRGRGGQPARDNQGRGNR